MSGRKQPNPWPSEGGRPSAPPPPPPLPPRRRVDLTAIADEFALDLRDSYTFTLALAFYWQDRCLRAEARAGDGVKTPSATDRKPDAVF